MYPDPDDLVIASGAITVDRDHHRVDTEAAAASDNLDTVTGPHAIGTRIWLLPANDARTIVVRHNVGNIICPNGQNLSLAEDDDYVELLRIGTNWVVAGYKSQALQGGGTFLGLTMVDATELTISAGGAVAATQTYHTVDTNGDAAQDDLDTITGGTAGGFLVLRPEAATRTVTLRHSIGANGIATPTGRSIDLPEITDFAILFFNGTQWIVLAASTLADVPSTLTIAAGAVAAVRAHHAIDTEAAAATDDLVTITGGRSGQYLLIRAANAARTVRITHSVVANGIATPGGYDIVLAEATDWALLVHDGTQWGVVGHSELNPTQILDPGNAGAIPVNRSGVCALTTAAGGETRTLAIPSRLGQRLTLIHGIDGGAVTVTVASA